MDIKELRESIINDPIKQVPAWTVAAFDPTRGDLPRRSPDTQGMALYYQELIKAGAPGILIQASTGWGHVRDFAEHQALIMEAGKIRVNGVMQVLLRMEDPLPKNITLLESIKPLDYGIVWTRRGSNLPAEASDEEVADHMLPLAKAITELGFPLGVYSISTVDGVPLSLESVKILMQKLGKELAAKLVAVKITEPDYESSTKTFLDDPLFKDKKIVQGWDSFYARALQDGLKDNGENQCGATSGAAACMVYAYQAMYEMAARQDWQALSRIQDTVSKVFFSMQGPDKTKFPDLQIAKWAMGLGHPLTESRSLDDTRPLLDSIAVLTEENDPDLKLILDSLLIMDAHDGYQSPIKEQLISFYP